MVVEKDGGIDRKKRRRRGRSQHQEEEKQERWREVTCTSSDMMQTMPIE